MLITTYFDSSNTQTPKKPLKNIYAVPEYFNSFIKKNAFSHENTATSEYFSMKNTANGQIFRE